MTTSDTIMLQEHPHFGPEALQMYRRKVLMAPWGWQSHPKHPQGGYMIDRSFFDKLHLSHSEMARDGYYPSVMRVHDDEGFTYGLVKDVLADDEGIHAETIFAKGWEQRFDEGLLDSWSPTWVMNFTHPVTGKTYEVMLGELSCTARRQFKNMRGSSPHYRNSEQETPMSDNNETTETTVENETSETEVENEEGANSLESTLEAIVQGQGKIANMLTALTAVLTKKNDGGETGEPAQVENNDVAARLRALELENVRLKIQQKAPHIHGAELDALSTVMLENSDQGEVLLKLAASQKPAPKKRTATISNTEIGNKATGGNNGAPDKVAELIEIANSQNLKYLQVSRHARENGIELTDAERNRLRAAVAV